MGIFDGIKKAWDDFRGKTQAKAAEKAAASAENMNQEALQIQRQSYEDDKEYRDALTKELDLLLAPLKQGVDSSTPDAFAQEFLDILSGSKKTPEQIQSDQASSQLLDVLMGKAKTSEQSKADTWADNYLNSLRNSPDTAFNAGVTSLQRGMADQKENLTRAINNRGISGSGIDLDKIAQTDANLARGISGLQGDRIDRQTQNLGTGSVFSGALADQRKTDLTSGVNLAESMAGKKQDNIAKAASFSSDYYQRAMDNLYRTLGLKTQLGTGVAAAGNLSNTLSNMGSTYAQNATNSAAQAASKQSNAVGAITDLIGLFDLGL